MSDHVDWDSLHCIFGCKHPVVGIYHLVAGYAVKPDQLQALCFHHKIVAEPLGHMQTIVERIEPGLPPVEQGVES